MTSIRLHDFSKHWCYAATTAAIVACLAANFTGMATSAALTEHMSEVSYLIVAVALTFGVIVAGLVAAVAVSLLGCGVFIATCAATGHAIRRLTGSIPQPSNSRSQEFWASADAGLGAVVGSAALGVVGMMHLASEASTIATLSTLVAASIAATCAVRTTKVAQQPLRLKTGTFVTVFSLINIAVALPSLPYS